MGSGRRRSRGNRGGAHPRHLRPSERKGAPQPAPRTGREQSSKAAAKRPRRGDPHDGPSPEAIARARARLSPPKAPWHPVPLAEMLIASGLALIIIAAVFASRDGIYAAFVLVMLGTLEFTWREHRHGYRSHGAVIGLCIGFLIGGLVQLTFGGQAKIAMGVGIVVALLVWNGLARTFEPAPHDDKEHAGV